VCGKKRFFLFLCCAVTYIHSCMSMCAAVQLFSTMSQITFFFGSMLDSLDPSTKKSVVNAMKKSSTRPSLSVTTCKEKPALRPTVLQPTTSPHSVITTKPALSEPTTPHSLAKTSTLASPTVAQNKRSSLPRAPTSSSSSSSSSASPPHARHDGDGDDVSQAPLGDISFADNLMDVSMVVEPEEAETDIVSVFLKGLLLFFSLCSFVHVP
jgi:hypothetical protein